MEQRSPNLSALLLAAALVSGCSPRTIAVRTTGDAIRRGSIAFNSEPDPAFAEAAMPGQLKLLEVLLKNDPANPDLLAALAEGFAGYAYLFVEDSDPARAGRFYKRAAGHALALLKTDRLFELLEILEPAKLDAVLSSADKENVPGLYWTALSWAGWANMAKNDAEALAALPKADKLMARVLELDPGYQFGGADLFYAISYCARPKIAGGDVALGKKHAEAAISRTGGAFLPAKLALMRYCAVQDLDEDLFKRTADEFAAADPGALPAARLANEVSKTKAAALMERFDDLF